MELYRRVLRIKKFYGTSENAVKTQIWIAVSVYVLVAIVKKRLDLGTTKAAVKMRTANNKINCAVPSPALRTSLRTVPPALREENFRP